ncbi:galactokinase [Heyndrickxia ginsengihumi]|uniref:Galactokinase n=1 Tax=Heyndrickxia ginsengihumi TaxID=363870 RepID=A0A0A6VID8_9BACI|nr:galactokinase [Heyndrickxia ginsengihumi]KHD86394.1 galactokinase [Heyndrickxia ginsengihumi]MBE6183381.1 galactokinase [Bacillus sp. (in: firmicutes)]MCM3024014.1 galactokinase [Heyndrickxia ginsengihumi]NEY19133.1 galactokinase [Heyndrickxia ginsengihumi]
MTIEHLDRKFYEYFQAEPVSAFFAPGRINLIGEHTDYNGGHVFPCAITLGTYALARKRDDEKIRFVSLNFEEKGIIEFTINQLNYDQHHGWANYPKGVIKFVKEQGYELHHGFDCLIYGNIPNGAGLSSSASIELLTGVMLETLYALQIPRIDLVKIGQQVENHYIGVNSGIMDQFAVGMGKKDTGIFLDCNKLEFEYAPIKLDQHQILIMNTNKRRELSDSKYNERRSECDDALAQLKKVVSIKSLGDLTEEGFEKNQHIIENKIVRKRAKHAVYENRRTINALKALKQGNLTEFGELINASHRSLRDDYEVTGKELDTLVKAAWAQEGVLGARMTGAGFGGCAIAIVEKDKVDAFIANVGAIYEQEVGYKADFYIASVGDGAKEIKLEEIS